MVQKFRPGQRIAAREIRIASDGPLPDAEQRITALPHVVGQVGQFANYIRHFCISPTARHLVASHPLACCGCAAILSLLREPRIQAVSYISRLSGLSVPVRTSFVYLSLIRGNSRKVAVFSIRAMPPNLSLDTKSRDLRCRVT